MPVDWVVAKLDYSNAFNSLHRDKMLAAVHSYIPQLDSFCRLAYEQPSVLRYGERQILSSEGVQQGDPLGPLLFSLTLHPLLSALKSDLRFGYLDDVTLGGIEALVEEDVRMLKIESPKIGLSLNIDKCELICMQIKSKSPILSTFMHQLPFEANLLGAPLLTGSSMNVALNKHCTNLERAIGRLKLISAHDALTILRHSLSAPKLNYMLRASPCAGHASLSTFDQLLRKAICGIVNLELTDDNWSQASLPVQFGGLGIRSVTSLAPSAFLASAAGTSVLQEAILPPLYIFTDDAVNQVQVLWSSLSGSDILTGLSSHSQKCWDDRVSLRTHSELSQKIQDIQNRARLLSASAPHSGDWLNALPISACGLRLDDEAVRVAIGLRLGSSLCEPHTCVCSVKVNRHWHTWTCL